MSVSPEGRVFVLGGGVAGLVAAFGCADRGHRVTLLESRQVCGGRAFSFVDRRTQTRLDNGPHAMLGCYYAMQRLVQRLGTADRFAKGTALVMAYRLPDGRVDRLQLAALPVPLAMPTALLRLQLPLAAKCRALWGMAAVLRGAPADWSLADWLQRRGQCGPPDAWLWRPLCRAIMNVEPDACAAADFLATLREAFLGGAARAAFWLPTCPWGEILADPAPAALQQAGVELRVGARVVGFDVAQRQLQALRLGDGQVIPLGPADQVVSALPWQVFRGLLAPWLELGQCGQLVASPIVTAHFRFAGTGVPDDGPVVALVDGDPFHFLLRTPGGPANTVALLSGGNRCFDGLSVAAIELLARRQLARYYPGFAVDEAADVRIAKENLATFVAAPGTAAHRPAPGRLQRLHAAAPGNLWVCGDWTATGLPATLEGAARSAEALLRQWG
jgi:squalene-associated FAD-dependent desaturase